MNSAHLSYFKSLFEGTAEISWHAWFSQHEEQLKAELPRAAFLRLKFKKLEEAEKYLREAKVSFRHNPAAVKREKYYALLHPSVLDEKGRPLESFRRQSYDGALGQLMDGDVEAGTATLQKFVKKVRHYPVDRRQEELESLCFDGEMELLHGDPAIALALLEAVATFPEGNDLTDFAVRTAKDLLTRMARETPLPAGLQFRHRLPHTRPPMRILMAANGLLCASTHDGLFLWHAATGEPLQSIQDLDEGVHQAVSALDLSPNGEYLATGMADFTTKVYSTRTGQRLARLSNPRRHLYNSAEQIRFSPDGAQLACAMGRTITCFRVGDWEPLFELKGHTSKVHLLEYVPVGNRLASAGGKYVKLWNTREGREHATLAGHKKLLGSIAVAPDGSFLASGGEDNQIILWNLPDGERLQTYTGHASYVFDLAIASDNRTVASREYDGQLHLWDTTSLQTKSSQHIGMVDRLQFSPDGKLLAVASQTGTRLIAVEDGSTISTLPDSWDVAFSPTGELLATGDGNAVVIWDVTKF